MILGIVAVATLLLIGVCGFVVGKAVTEDAIKTFKENKR